MRGFGHLGSGFAAGLRGEGVFPGQAVAVEQVDGGFDVSAAAGNDAVSNLAAAAFPGQGRPPG